MLSSLFRKGGGGKKKASLDRVLGDLVKMGPNSANCSLIKSGEGEDSDQDLGRAFIFKHMEETLVQNKTFFMSTPDGIKAEEKSLLAGKDELIHLWFLHNKIPHTMDCRVVGRIRFPDDIRADLDPRVPIAYALRPVGNIHKSDKRQFLRYSHKAGHGGTRVYSQVLFDLFATKTDVTFPQTGSLPPRIDDLHLLPYTADSEISGKDPEEVVKFMKNALRLNSRESRVVYVGKPHMDDRTNKVSLLEMGKSDVLGLETSKEDSRTFYIRKPPLMSSDRKEPLGLGEGDTIVLGFHTRVSTEADIEYYDLVSEVTRVGTENMTVRTGGNIRQEGGIALELLDFSVGGIKASSSSPFLNYVLGEDQESMKLEEQIESLENLCFLLNFYPKLRFNRETEFCQPDLPMRIQILSKIVRTELTKPKSEEEAPGITGFGMKFYYDPSEYSRDTFTYDRWDLIRDFKENKHFRVVHNSLNQLIGFLESQSRT